MTSENYYRPWTTTHTKSTVIALSLTFFVVLSVHVRVGVTSCRGDSDRDLHSNVGRRDRVNKDTSQCPAVAPQDVIEGHSARTLAGLFIGTDTSDRCGRPHHSLVEWSLVDSLPYLRLPRCTLFSVDLHWSFRGREYCGVGVSR